MSGDDNFDPDTNFHDSFDDDEEEVDLESAEGLAWQLLLLINPGDEDAALHQFAAYRETMAEDPSAEPIDTIKTVIDWRAGFHVSADEPKLLIEAIDELVSRFGLTIDWGGDADDEDFLDDQDAAEQVADVQREDGDGGGQGVAQGVDQHDAGARQALDLGGADVVGA